jgi:hypothetical protein
MSERARARNEVWDACVEVLGYAPLTRIECKLWGQITKSLNGAGADRETIVAVASVYRKRWPNVVLTITALEKWYSHFRAEAMQRALRQPPCPSCGVGGGMHSAECATVQGEGRAPARHPLPAFAGESWPSALEKNGSP